ncbi:arylesterase [Roseicyclus mahoneyensis]|uniref:Acyl-CoA thioesterase-1 n=1 Tax=Roseicyclus mahoneyensis TaxID=164332 RepID=A0A316GDZ0_9RHOB|nr:arylesterase [Roseicyclus mahoneyensis]PWK59108.1 acyl-CoA thioesterase-1 [Roseicyclus mahoneyensis]
MGKVIALVLGCAAPAAAQEITIAALGDSLTQGYGLLQEDGFTVQLHDWLRARGHDVAVVNAGVSGDTTAGGLARVGWTLTPEVDAMIVALGGNDLLRAIPPEASRANLEGILQAAEAAGVAVLLVGMEAPGNYGPEFKQAFDAMYPELAEAYGVLHAGSFFDALNAAAEADTRAAMVAYMQSDGIHPNAAGVALIVEVLGPEVERLIALLPQS